MKIYITEKIQSFKNGSKLVFHGTDTAFEIHEYDGKHFGFHFGDVRTAWNFSEDKMESNHGRHREMGHISGLDYGPQLIIANLDGNFMDFVDLEIWANKDFMKCFEEDFPEIFGNFPQWDYRLGIYGNLNRPEVKKLLNADDFNADIDGLRYLNEFDSASLGPTGTRGIKTYLKKRGVSDADINAALENKSKTSYLVMNKNCIKELYTDTKNMYQ